jgi:hypothetical protein
VQKARLLTQWAAVCCCIMVVYIVTGLMCAAGVDSRGLLLFVCIMSLCGLMQRS